MNPTALHDRLDDIAAVVAISIDEHDRTRAVAAWWHHRGPRALWVAAAGALTMPFGGLHPAALLTLAAATLAAFAGSRAAGWAHDVRLYDDANPCPHCPPAEHDDGGPGDVWLNLGNDIPPAPAPMPELDDDRIRDWVGDLDAQLVALVEEVSP